MRIGVLTLLVVACASKHETTETKVEMKVVPAVGSAVAKAPPASTPEAACGSGVQDACVALVNDDARKPSERAALLQKLCDGGSWAACNSVGATKVDGSLGGKDVAGAIALFTKSCDAGNGVGCGNLGVAYYQGLAGPKDAKRGVELMQKGCTHGSAHACANAGQIIGDGDGVPQDVPAATALLRKGCAGHDDDACRMLFNAAKLLVGSDNPPAANVTLAIDSFSQLCDADNGAACAEAGWVMENATGGKDPSFAKMYERGCKLDDGAACYHHGRIAHDAAAFERACKLHDARACNELIQPLLAAGTPEKAFPFVEEACRVGDKAACVTGCKIGDAYVCELLAGNYENGTRFGKDDALAKRGKQRAVELREKGCKANDAKSCFDLGFAYHEGKAVKRDHAKGQALTEKACKLGALDACFDLAERKYKGLDRPKDEAGGIADYQDVCERGYKASCGSLGFLYAQGEGGLAKDGGKAIEMFTRGCAEEAAWSCYEAGTRLLAKDRDAGIAKLRSACRWGDDRGCKELEKHGISEREDPAHTMVFR